MFISELHSSWEAIIYGFCMGMVVIVSYFGATFRRFYEDILSYNHSGELVSSNSWIVSPT